MVFISWHSIVLTFMQNVFFIQGKLDNWISTPDVINMLYLQITPDHPIYLFQNLHLNIESKSNIRMHFLSQEARFAYQKRCACLHFWLLESVVWLSLIGSPLQVFGLASIAILNPQSFLYLQVYIFFEFHIINTLLLFNQSVLK